MQLHTTRAAVRKRARYHLAAALLTKRPRPRPEPGCAVTGAPAVGLGRGRRRLPTRLRGHVHPCGRRLLSAKRRLSVGRSRRATLPFSAFFRIFCVFFIIESRAGLVKCQKRPGCGRLRKRTPPPMHLNLPDSARASGEALPPRRRCGCASSAPPALFLRPFPFQRFCLFTAFSRTKAGGPPALQRKSQKRYSPALRQAFFLRARPCIYKAAKTCYDESSAAGGGFFVEQGSAHVFRKQPQGPCRRYFYRKEGFYAFDPKRHGA